MRARLIVIRRISEKNSPQVPLAEDYHLIQALAAQCADQTFGTTILPNFRKGQAKDMEAFRPLVSLALALTGTVARFLS